MMTRRDVLKLLGFAAAAAALPSILKGRQVAAPAHCVGPTAVFECAPLEAGKTYTFTAHVRAPGGAWNRAEWKGLFVTGIEAKGGETAIQVPIDAGATLHGPVLSLEGLGFYLPRRASNAELIDFTKRPALIADARIFTPRRNVLR